MLVLEKVLKALKSNCKMLHQGNQVELMKTDCLCLAGKILQRSQTSLYLEAAVGMGDELPG